MTQQVNPTSPERTATAPYNFVPLPERVISVVAESELPSAETDGTQRQATLDQRLPPHDGYGSGLNSGYIEVELETLSPLFIRGMLTAQQFQHQEEDKYADGKPLPKGENPQFARLVKNLPDFFNMGNANQPVIPGSSLHGMLRYLLEIVSFSKVQPVTDKQLFFRTVDDSTVGKAYSKRMRIGERDDSRVQAGFLVRRGDDWWIRPCEVVRVHRSKLVNDWGQLYDGKPPNRTPRWQGQTRQHRYVWVYRRSGGKFADEIAFEEHPGFEPGVLVITGDIPKKKKEFVFLLHDAADDQSYTVDDSSSNIPVPEDMIRGFEGEDQITQWQQKAFPVDRPSNGSRDEPGRLMRNPKLGDEPVFFLMEKNKDGKDELTFFGRAGMFRLPYKHRPVDLIPKELRHPTADQKATNFRVDFAEAIFGFVRGHKLEKEKAEQGDRMRAYASRVSMTHAVLQPDQIDVWLTTEPLVPKIMATPKPTAFQHYLVQTGQDKFKLLPYDDPDSYRTVTVIRGHKMYWHQGNPPVNHLKAEAGSPGVDLEGNVALTSTQHTRIRPVRAGVRFKFRIHFDNLSDAELGALMWILTLPGEEGRQYCHSLGMGKPLGMGAVILKPTLYLINRTTRYTSLFADGQSAGWHIGLEAPTQDYVGKFEEMMKSRLGAANTPGRFRDVPRIQRLLKLLEWRDPDPHRAQKRNMALDRFRQRPVLPDPLYVGEQLANQRGAVTSSQAQTRPKPQEPSVFEREEVVVLSSVPDKSGRAKGIIQSGMDKGRTVDVIGVSPRLGRGHSLRVIIAYRSGQAPQARPKSG